MDKFDRIYELHSLFSQRQQPISLRDIQQEIECSESTARRAIRQLRDFLGAPIVYDRERRGYRYQRDQHGPYEFPGLWFTAEEAHALLTAHQLLEGLQPGILSAHIAPLKSRLQALLTRQRPGNPDIGHRIRILQMAARPTELQHFRRIASALFERRRLRILYHGRERDRTTERTVSPQRLVHYRSNWYLDAWCHLRNELRSFSLDRLQPVETLAEAAREMNDETLDNHYANSYGIFAGEPRHTAILHFSPQAARWVADEQWHPQQQSEVFSNGSLELRIPYSDPRELVMDILKYAADVEVIEPPALREQVRKKLRDVLDKYK